MTCEKSVHFLMAGTLAPKRLSPIITAHLKKKEKNLKRKSQEGLARHSNSFQFLNASINRPTVGNIYTDKYYRFVKSINKFWVGWVALSF